MKNLSNIIEGILDVDLDVTEDDINIIGMYCKKYRNKNTRPGRRKFVKDAPVGELIRLLLYSGGKELYDPHDVIKVTNAIKDDKCIFRFVEGNMPATNVYVASNKKFYRIYFNDAVMTWDEPNYKFPIKNIMSQLIPDRGTAPQQILYTAKFRYIIVDKEVFEKLKKELNS